MSQYVNCQHCINKACKKYGGPYGYTFCGKYIPDIAKQITNADHIRSMSDEELAEFINCCTSGDGAPDFCRRLPECDDDLESDTLIPFERCNQCLLYWLRHPVIQGVTYE